jgi:hypothetical protein
MNTVLAAGSSSSVGGVVVSHPKSWCIMSWLLLIVIGEESSAEVSDDRS